MILLGVLAFLLQKAKAQDLDSFAQKVEKREIREALKNNILRVGYDSNNVLEADLNLDLENINPYLYFQKGINSIKAAADAEIMLEEKSKIKPFIFYSNSAAENESADEFTGGACAKLDFKKSSLTLEGFVNNYASTSSTSTFDSSSEHFVGANYDYTVTVDVSTEINDLRTRSISPSFIAEYLLEMNDKISAGGFGSFVYNHTAITGQIDSTITTTIDGEISGSPVHDVTVDEESTPLNEKNNGIYWSAGGTGRFSLDNLELLCNAGYDSGKIRMDGRAVFRNNDFAAVINADMFKHEYSASLLIPSAREFPELNVLTAKEEKKDRINKFSYADDVKKSQEELVEKGFEKNYKDVLALKVEKNKEGIGGEIIYYNKHFKIGVGASETNLSATFGLYCFDINASYGIVDKNVKGELVVRF